MLKLKKKMRTFSLNSLLVLLLTTMVSGCRDVAVPRPRGYFRIDLPSKEYLKFDDVKENYKDLPLLFEYPVYGKIISLTEENKQPGWLNIEFPSYKAKIYLTYKDINNNFAGLLEQTYRMNVKNHVSKADAIREQVIANKGNKVYGILYDLKGNTATAVQFYVTDSVKHFLRGSLYFEAVPNADSLAPVIDFFRSDIVHLIETLKWKN
jgi:gliding motility-associated lipoprotein GldD